MIGILVVGAIVVLYTSVLLDGVKILIEMGDTEPWD